MANFLHVVAWNQLVVFALAAAVWVVSSTRLFHERPALRHGFWLLVLLKFVAPALIPVPFLPAVADEGNLKNLVHGETVETTQNAHVTLVDPAVERAESRNSATQATKKNFPSDARFTSRIWLPVVSVLALSLLVSVWLWVTAIRQVWRIRQLLSGSGCEHGRTFDALQDVRRCFGLQKEPRLVVVDESISPMLWAGSGRPAIVLPRTLTMSIGDAQLRHILAHELAHFVRRDHWGNLLSFFVTSLFWWNPIAWLARRELRTAAESCCDAMAINRLAGSRKSYAQTLLAVVDFVTSSKPFQPTVAATFGESRSLKRRIEMVANPSVKTSLPRSGLLLVVCGVVLLTLVPARAQQKAPDTSGTATATPEPPGPGAGSFDGPVDWLACLSAVNKSIEASQVPLPGPAGRTESSPGPEVGPESNALRTAILTVLDELAKRGKGVDAFARHLHLRPDPGCMTLVLHITLIPANKGGAPPDGKTIHAFLSQWFKNVTARGVKMRGEQIKTVPSDRGNGVDLEVSLTLLSVRTQRAKNTTAKGTGLEQASPGAGSFDASKVVRLPGTGSEERTLDFQGVDTQYFSAVLRAGTAGKTKSPPGTEKGPASHAPQKSIPTVLVELAKGSKGVHADVRSMHLRRSPETDPGCVKFVMHITLIPTDEGGAPLDGKTIHAFLSQWFENVTARGVKMTGEQIKTAPSDRGNGVDLEFAGTLR